MKNTQAYLKYIVALLLFGSNGIVASQIGLSSYEIVFTRTLIGSLFLILIFLLSRQKFQAGKSKLHLLFLSISGAALGASWICLYEAYTQIGVSLATLAYYCGPVIVMVLSPLVFREKITGAVLLGLLAVIVGMLCVNGVALFQGGGSWGLLLGVLSAGMYALMVIYNKKATSMNGLENPTLQVTASFLTVALFMGFKQGFTFHGIAENWLPILFLGIVNTGVGCYFYFSAIGKLPVQTVSICGYLEPLSALLFSAALLGEKLSPLQIVGAGLILGGAASGELLRGKAILARRVGGLSRGDLIPGIQQRNPGPLEVSGVTGYKGITPL